jgi:hypothetical protein
MIARRKRRLQSKKLMVSQSEAARRLRPSAVLSERSEKESEPHNFKLSKRES